MPSAFGWLDSDNEQRRTMLEVVDLFKEEGTVDELGTGSIRDALADALFPGTSVLHTRLRYVLFIPWLLQRAAREATPTEMSAEFKRLEYRLITSLMAGGENLGVIGNRARNDLKRMPSAAYWSALGVWGIRTRDFSSDGFFRRQLDYRRLVRRTTTTDDPEARVLLPETGLDPYLPGSPEDLLSAAHFKLTVKEEQYLSERIAALTRGSMLSWLIRNVPGNMESMPSYVWDIDNLNDAPDELVALVDHARRFHTTIHGAVLICNLLLARKSRRDDMVDMYEIRLDEWREELHETAALQEWSRTDWWAAIRRNNPRVKEPTIVFFNRWLDLIGSDVDLVRGAEAGNLISTRERQIKVGRARLVNQAALDRWSGASGLGRLDFRWTVGRSHLMDLYAAREAS